MTTRRILRVALACAFVVAVVGACAAPGFDSQAKLASVRVLAVQADKPYASPGDTVTLQALTVDARADKSTPMHVYWLPFDCVNPASDLYYACFSSFAGFASSGGQDGGAPDGGRSLGTVTKPTDITSFLVEGPTYSVKLPSDIVTAHPAVPGAPDPYGLSITFFIACAGHVFLIPPGPSTGPAGQFVPVACGSSPDDLLGANDYVFSFTRIYAYAPLMGHDGSSTPITNANPIIDKVTFDGETVDVTQGVVVPRCSSGTCDHPVDVAVPMESWELNPTDVDPSGTVRHEQIYAEYFYTIGGFKSDGRVLYDPTLGAVTPSANPFNPPGDQENGTLWIVVHDNRDGVAWVSFPVYVN